MNKFIIKKCEKCGAMVKIFKDCTCEDCGIQCCGEPMKELVPNSVDAAAEKHVPTYQVYGEKIMAKVNHAMDEDHYIEWIACVYENRERIKYLNPGEDAEVTFKYRPGATLYAYCNKHGLWKKEVE